MLKKALVRTLSFVCGAFIGLLLFNWCQNIPLETESLAAISVLAVIVFFVHLALAYIETHSE